jgi:glycosyltransferase involved in cell wall biosynthesis
MKQDLVSVIIPAYNASEFIEECILSVANQTYRPLEIVIIDDASTDSTFEIITNLKEELKDLPDLAIILLRNSINKGAAYTINKGFKLANGSYLAWISADDIYTNDTKTSIQIEKMNRTQSDWSYFDSFYIGSSIGSSILMTPTYLPKFKIFNLPFEKINLLRFLILFFRNPIQGSSLMISRSTYNDSGGFEPALMNADADGDLWFRLSLSRARVCVIHNMPSVFYRTHKNQLSNDLVAMNEGYITARNRALKLFINKLKGDKV